MQIKVTVERSKEWIKAQRIATGTNAPESIEVSIDPAQLSDHTRKLLIDYRGSYDDLRSVYFNSAYQPMLGSTYGCSCVKIDADAPTIAQIDEAIKAAFQNIDQRRAKVMAERAQREAEAEANRAAQKAAAEERERKMTEARELLADELSEATQWKDNLDTVSGFLSNVPDDALRGALKAMVASGAPKEIATLKAKIENASTFLVFDDDEDASDDQ